MTSVPPELYLKDLSITLGSGSGYHMLMGSQMAAGSAAPRMILDNANATCNGLYVGYNKVSGNADVMRPVLAITNGTLNITWNCTMPNDVGGIEPIVRVGTGGVFSRTGTTAAGGMTFTRQFDVRVEDGGQIFVKSILMPSWLEKLESENAGRVIPGDEAQIRFVVELAE